MGNGINKRASRLSRRAEWAGIHELLAETGVYFALVPSRIQAYRGYDELPGREVMRDGIWLDEGA